MSVAISAEEKLRRIKELVVLWDATAITSKQLVIRIKGELGLS